MTSLDYRVSVSIAISDNPLPKEVMHRFAELLKPQAEQLENNGTSLAARVNGFDVKARTTPSSVGGRYRLGIQLEFDAKEYEIDQLRREALAFRSKAREALTPDIVSRSKSYMLCKYSPGLTISEKGKDNTYALVIAEGSKEKKHEPTQAYWKATAASHIGAFVLGALVGFDTPLETKSVIGHPWLNYILPAVITGSALAAGITEFKDLANEPIRKSRRYTKSITTGMKHGAYSAGSFLLGAMLGVTGQSTIYKN